MSIYVNYTGEEIPDKAGNTGGFLIRGDFRNLQHTTKRKEVLKIMDLSTMKQCYLLIDFSDGENTYNKYMIYAAPEERFNLIEDIQKQFEEYGFLVTAITEVNSDKTFKKGWYVNKMAAGGGVIQKGKSEFLQLYSPF